MYIKSLRNFKSMPSLIKPQANCKSNQSFTYLRHILITRCQTKNFNIRASLCDIFYSFVTWTIYTFTYITCCHINLIPPFWNVIERNFSIHHTPISVKSYPTLLEWMIDILFIDGSYTLFLVQICQQMPSQIIERGQTFIYSTNNLI